MSALSDLGAAIRAAGLRPRDIVRALDISWTALSKWQRREVCPRGDHLLGLADLIGLSPRETLDLVLPAPAAAEAA